MCFEICIGQIQIFHFPFSKFLGQGRSLSLILDICALEGLNLILLINPQEEFSINIIAIPFEQGSIIGIDNSIRMFDLSRFKESGIGGSRHLFISIIIFPEGSGEQFAIFVMRDLTILLSKSLSAVHTLWSVQNL